ncbi:MAG: hypothetical protein AMXMBFR48_14710 [Ignavibacteriales bacterium]
MKITKKRGDPFYYKTDMVIAYVQLLLRTGVTRNERSEKKLERMHNLFIRHLTFQERLKNEYFYQAYRQLPDDRYIEQAALKLREFFNKDYSRSEDLKKYLRKQISHKKPDPSPLIIPRHRREKEYPGNYCGEILFYDLFTCSLEENPEFKPFQYQFFSFLSKLYSIGGALEYIKRFHGEKWYEQILHPPECGNEHYEYFKQLEEEAKEYRKQQRLALEQKRAQARALKPPPEKTRDLWQRVIYERKKIFSIIVNDTPAVLSKNIYTDEELKKFEELQKMPVQVCIVFGGRSGLYRVQRGNRGEWRTLEPGNEMRGHCSSSIVNQTFYEYCCRLTLAIRRFEEESGTEILSYFKPEGNCGKFYLLPGGDTLLAAGGTDTLYLICNHEGYVTGERKTAEVVQNSALSPDGKFLAVKYGDNYLAVYELSTMKKVREDLTFSGDVLHLSFSPAGALAISTYDGRLFIISGANFEDLIELHGHEGKIYTAAFNSDGSLLAGGGTAAFIYCWEMEGLTLTSKARVSRNKRWQTVKVTFVEPKQEHNNSEKVYESLTLDQIIDKYL